jgi:hypothetical protein
LDVRQTLSPLISPRKEDWDSEAQQSKRTGALLKSLTIHLSLHDIFTLFSIQAQYLQGLVAFSTYSGWLHPQQFIFFSLA